jgi:branched-chain amino acid transport system ATP-binding protein
MLLSTSNLSIQFGGLAAVDDVDFEADTGEIVGLIGPNGSGKTTFFNIITGIYRPSAGRVMFNGREISALPAHQITRLGIARTFQSSRLFLDLSIVDNVLIGMHSRQKTNLWRALFRPGFSARELLAGIAAAETLFDLFDEKNLLADMHRKAGEIPHADKRLLEICRALAAEPQLLLLDEPSSGMNPQETMQLMNNIQRLKERRRDLSIIIVEHDMKVIKGVTQRVVVFNYGKKIAEGSYEEISRNPNVVAAYLGGEKN